MIRKLHRDDRGVAAVEAAFVIPVLFVFIYGIFQLGAVFAANAIMQSALGEGARYATIWPVRSDAEIKTRIENKVMNIYAGTFTVSDPVTTTVAASDMVPERPASGGNPAVPAQAGVDAVKKTVLTITYSVTPDLIFFQPPPVSLTRTKTAYMPIEAAS